MTEMKMTAAEAIKALEDLQQLGDAEIAHIKADGVLCDLLDDLGYSEVVAAWAKIDKYYA
jgi:hypothetical protein